MRLQRYLLVPVALGLLALWALSRFWPVRPAQITTSSTSAVSTPRETLPPAVRAGDVSPGKGGELFPQSTAPALSREGRPQAKKRRVGLLATEINEITSEDAFMGRFLAFRQQVLLDQPRRDEYRNMLSDSKSLAKVRQDLIFPEELSPSRKNELRRLIGIDYLREALSWSENPQRVTLFSILEDIILTDNFNSSIDDEMRQSIAADKLELFDLLREHAADRAERIIERSRGTRMEALIQYISLPAEQRAKFDATN